MQIKYLGHSTFSIFTKNKHLLFDPYITENPLVENKDISNIMPDYILASHGHGDHVLDIEAIAKQSGAVLISNYEITHWFEQKEIKNHPLSHGGKNSFDFGTVKYVQAVHTSTLPDGSNGGDPGGFVIWNDETCFYFAGDTGLTMDMKLIPLSCPKLDFAILPIGDNFTMGYEDAIIASDFIQCDKIIGCHFDTFPYIETDTGIAKQKFEEKGKELIVMKIGSTIEL